MGVRQRVAYARELVAEGHSPSVLARVLQISRQAIYRIATRPPAAAVRSRVPVDDLERAIVEVAEQNPTDGYRIVTAWVRRKLRRRVNRKRVLRVMRERRLIQHRTHEPRRRRLGFFQVQRPGQLWHLDMTSIWVAEHGWVYLNGIIDCCTREIVGWELSLRCRAVEAITVIERAVAEQCILPGTLTLGTDNGSAFVARATRLVVLGHPFVGDSVFVINGATCDATDRTGCGQTPATVTLVSDPLGIAYNPWGIAVDQATDAIYTANIADGEGPGTVSVINGATCNGHDINGCGQTPATASAGFGANGIAIDRTTHKIYVTNTEDTSVTVMDGAACNATNTNGCSATSAKASVGGYPGSIGIDPAVGTAYVQTIDGVSVIPLIP